MEDPNQDLIGHRIGDTGLVVVGTTSWNMNYLDVANEDGTGRSVRAAALVRRSKELNDASAT